MQKNWKFKTGIILIALSAVFFGALLGVPFLETGSRQKITISTVLIVLGEISFWSGGILLGKELFSKYKALMNPVNWFKKKAAPGSIDNDLDKTL